MPISFECDQCGKAYVVSDGLAGKKAQCKQCGNRMTIPAGSAQPRTPSAVPVSRPRPIPSNVPSADDLYGLNDEPSRLPPLSSRLSGSDGASGDDEPVKKKKKKRGFFSSSAAKKPNAAGSTGTSLASKIVTGIFIFLAVAGGIRTFGLASKSDIMKFNERQFMQLNQLIGYFKSVRDVQSAGRASGPCNQLLTDMYNELSSQRLRKARLADIRAVELTLAPRIQTVEAQLTRELQRIEMIPGAPAALNIEVSFNRLLQLSAELAAENARAGMH